MPKAKIGAERLEEFVSFLKEKGEYNGKRYYKNGRKEFKKRFDIERAALQKWTRRAVENGLLSEEEYAGWVHDGGMRSIKVREEKYGKEKYARMMHDSWSRGVGSDPGTLEIAARNGGFATQKNHAHVRKNLENFVEYGPKEDCYYGNVSFRSKEERLIGLTLHNLGILDVNDPESTNKRMGRKEVDFYTGDLVIEYHPIVKNHSEILETKEDYIRHRTEQLKAEGYSNPILFIFKPTASEIWHTLNGNGHRIDYSTVQDKMRDAREDIKRFNTYLERAVKFLNDNVPKDREYNWATVTEKICKAFDPGRSVDEMMKKMKRSMTLDDLMPELIF